MREASTARLGPAGAAGSRWPARRVRRARAAALLVGLAGALSLPAAASAEAASASPGAPSPGFKRIAPPQGSAIQGLEGFAGRTVRLYGGAEGKLAGGLDHFRHRVLRGPDGRVRRVVRGARAIPPPGRRRPALGAQAGGLSKFAAAMPGPHRLKPGMRALGWPLDGVKISSGFGLRRHPILGGPRPHLGIDLVAPRGTPVRAASDGTVRARGRNGGYGHYVRLDHGFGLHTAYGHLSRYAEGLRPGRRVARGQVIGYVGSSGRSTGPHLHYEVWMAGRAVDPVDFLPVAVRRYQPG